MTDFINNNIIKRNISFLNKKKEQFNIILKNISIKKLDIDLNILDEIKNKTFLESDSKTTNINILSDNILKPKIQTIISKDKITMKYFNTLNIINNLNEVRCYHCRRYFSSAALGIPINYNSKEDTFDCDGIVCSFNCMISFEEIYSNPIYNKTVILIPFLYYKIFGKYPYNIKKSPNWRLRKDYGGNLSDEDIENSLQIVEYNDIKQITFNHYGRIFQIKN